MAQPHVANPRTLTVDKNPAHPRAVADMQSDGQLWRRTRLRQCEYLNNIVEQDHRRIKRLVRPGLGFGSFRTARQTLAGFETMAMMRKGQLQKITVMISAAKPSSSPTCSKAPHKRPGGLS
jgi:transposase, IS6 family